MPHASVRLVRLALLYFVGGTTLGNLMLIDKAWPVLPTLALLRPVHAEVLLFGFLVQLAFGVAHWILPRVPGPATERRITLATLALNAGVCLVAFGGVGQVVSMIVAGRIAEAFAVGAFGLHIHPRVRAALGGH